MEFVARSRSGTGGMIQLLAPADGDLFEVYPVTRDLLKIKEPGLSVLPQLRVDERRSATVLKCTRHLDGAIAPVPLPGKPCFLIEARFAFEIGVHAVTFASGSTFDAGLRMRSTIAARVSSAARFSSR